jgi:mannose-6-phosphate isomerase-like protein (cupin superfamily)
MSDESGPEIQIVSVKDAPAVVFGDPPAMKSHRLIRRDMGSKRVSLNFTVTEQTSEEFDSVYPDNDELMYIISGVGEIWWEGSERKTVSAGMAIFIPQGRLYRYRVIDAPQEAVVVFGPAYSQVKL